MEKTYEFVDLGLPSGTLWAKCNIGAATETDYGDYFMWGSTTPDTNTPCDWVHTPFNGGASHFDIAYFNAHKAEYLTEEGNLKPQYDTAHVIMGGDWRMPTRADFEELLRYTTNDWVENYQGSGVNGILFTSKANGNTLFMPAAGFRNGSSFYGRGVYGDVWSSLLNADYPYDAWRLNFSSDNCGMYYGYLRCCGFSVRGVMKKEEIVLKGFVAVDNGGDKMTWNPSGRRVILFEKKPFRDTLTRTPYWASPYSNIKLDWNSFLHMSWNDEPIEVELKVMAK